jgi:hypothetical protein
MFASVKSPGTNVTYVPIQSPIAVDIVMRDVTGPGLRK